jgi:hypothetical protein
MKVLGKSIAFNDAALSLNQSVTNKNREVRSCFQSSRFHWMFVSKPEDNRKASLFSYGCHDLQHHLKRKLSSFQTTEKQNFKVNKPSKFKAHRLSPTHPNHQPTNSADQKTFRNRHLIKPPSSCMLSPPLFLNLLKVFFASLFKNPFVLNFQSHLVLFCSSCTCIYN